MRRSHLVSLLSFTLLSVLGCGWNPQLYRTNTTAQPVSRAPESFSLVSLNTWRLREPTRIARIVDALQAWERALFVEPSATQLPDVIVFQELEGDQALDTLRQALAPTHTLHVEVCARTPDGHTRSAVGVAVKRSRFTVNSTQRLELGTLFPDHSRCAIAASLDAPSQHVTIVSVHLSSRPGNGPQAERFVSALRNAQLLDGRPLLVAGDYNFHPHSAGYRILTGVLTDPHATESRPTHWFGGRIDFTFASPTVQLVSPLDASIAYQIAKPGDGLSYPQHCLTRDPANCPVSDHIPVGGVFRTSRSD